MAANPKRLHFNVFITSLKYLSIGTFDPSAAKPSVNKIHFIAQVSSWFIIEILVIGGCFDAVNLYENINTIENLTLSMTKFTTLSLNRDLLHGFVKLVDCDAVPRTGTDAYVNKSTSDTLIILRNYLFMATMVGFSYFSAAIFLEKPQNAETASENWEIVHLYVPYDIVIFQRFGIIRAIGTVVMFYHAYCHVFLDILSVSLFTHIGRQFEAVADLFVNVPYSGNKEESRIRLSEAIEYHTLILRYAVDLQRMYNGTFFLQIIGCCLPLCFCMFLAAHDMKTAGTNLMDVASHASLLAAFMYQLYLYTRSADLLKERALLVAEGVYLSDWHLASPSARRDLTWVMARAQRPINYSALGIFPMTIATFSQIVKSAYGALSFLTSVD